jgi:hypothetical protein
MPCRVSSNTRFLALFIKIPLQFVSPLNVGQNVLSTVSARLIAPGSRLVGFGPDIVARFNKPQMEHSGYSVKADVSMLRDQYTLGLAYEEAGIIKICLPSNSVGSFKGI